MSRKFALLLRRQAAPQPEANLVLNALASAILVLCDGNRVQQVNSAGETLLGLSAQQLSGMNLKDLLPADSPLFSLIDQVRLQAAGVAEYGVTMETPRIGSRILDIHVAPLLEMNGWVVISLHEQSMAQKIGYQLTHRNSARSVSAMAALMAHEVKNPLSGIRGAAQILEEYCAPEDQVLARLIRDEADRIFALVERMEMFSDGLPLERGPVNIHRVLEHVRRIAEAGFGRHLRFVEAYDPSLPPVYGNRDQLIQVFLNLVKNAAEAAPLEGGEVTLGTAYQQGVRLALPGIEGRVHLPLVVTVTDNGDGIHEDLRPNLFDPFVTSKATGTGLGLSLVAKIVGDHGGVVEFDSAPRKTVFRVMLPMVQKQDDPP
jgi:two-component system nitrogen regulation sensor histidine kinase GlnL